MGVILKIRAEDNHLFNAYFAQPSSVPRGGLIILQEVFGVNQHIRSIVDRFAIERNYIAIAPYIFDRLEPGVALGYSDADLAHGRSLRLSLGWEKPLLDIAAARIAISAVEERFKVGVVGFCWGGSLAWISACRLSFQAAVCYYGGQIVQFCNEHPICPVMMHFGLLDPIIPETDRKTIVDAQPELLHYYYNAGHGFNCNERKDFHPGCAAESWNRTQIFLEKHIT